MDKILFSNSFKNLMVALGAKTSDSSYAVPLINKTSGAPQGYMEMSALASVLGGVYTQLQGNTSIGSYGEVASDMFRKTGVFSAANAVASTITGQPNQSLNVGFVLINYFADPYGLQILMYNKGEESFTYIRFLTGNKTWYKWFRIGTTEVG